MSSATKAISLTNRIDKGVMGLMRCLPAEAGCCRKRIIARNNEAPRRIWPDAPNGQIPLAGQWRVLHHRLRQRGKTSEKGILSIPRTITGVGGVCRLYSVGPVCCIFQGFRFNEEIWGFCRLTPTRKVRVFDVYEYFPNQSTINNFAPISVNDLWGISLSATW